MNDPFNEMAIFASIAEHGSFTSAAKALGRSKAYVSQQMTKLEESLNIQLLFRTTRKVSLTEAGKVYLGYCQDIIKSAWEAQQSIAALQGEMTGSIYVSASNSFGEIVISECLFAFQEAYPKIEINLDLSDDIKDLKTDNIDIVIRGNFLADEDLVAIPLIDWQMLVVGTPEYFSNHSRPNHPSELINHNCIGVKRETRGTGWPFMVDGAVNRIIVDGDFSVNRNPLIKEAALRGKGIAWLPSYVAYRELAEGTLVSVLEDFASPSFTFYVAYLYQKAIPLKQRRLIDFIKNWFSEKNTPDIHRKYADTNIV